MLVPCSSLRRTWGTMPLNVCLISATRTHVSHSLIEFVFLFYLYKSHKRKLGVQEPPK